MKPIRDLLREDGFLMSLFESIPCGVLIADRDRRVHALNNVLERTFDISSAVAFGKRGGEALGCVHASESPEGCGYSESCRDCRVRRAAEKALSGGKTYRDRAEVRLTLGGRRHDLVLLVSAAPLEHGGEPFAVVLLEDITELSALRRRLRTEHAFSGIVGRHEKMREVFEVIGQVADSRVPVLIQGESGTGKELVAAAIHNESPRASKHFVPVNCAALPDGLLESELFGHVRGAFTGAIRDKKGRFELADGGTIFLDEIGDLGAPMQVKLLRVLQEGAFEPVGDERTHKVDVRIISATNRDLRKEVAEGRFREDLFYRLCVVPILLPPLRERRNDIPLLAKTFVDRANEEAGCDRVLSPDALSTLMEHGWPGNVRELQNAVHYALVKCGGGAVIERIHLPPEVRRTVPNRDSRRVRGLKLESRSVADALKDAGGNKAKAARILGVGRATLYRFISREELSRETPMSR